MSKKHHYVDNKMLFDVLVAYRTEVAERPHDPPPIPEYVGECLLKIATRLSHKPSFASYSFRDDMIADAVENGILYLHNFDPNKSKNPFAYFTQITHFAFIRRIEREKKHVYTKLKYAMHKAHQREDYVTQEGEPAGISGPAWMSYDNIHDFIRNYEHKLTATRAADRRPERAYFDDPFVADEGTDTPEPEYDRGVDGIVERLAGGDDDALDEERDGEE